MTKKQAEARWLEIGRKKLAMRYWLQRAWRWVFNRCWLCGGPSGHTRGDSLCDRCMSGN